MAKSTPRLSTVTLRVPQTKLEDLKYFYTKVLGMNNFLDPEESVHVFFIPQSHPALPTCFRKHNSIDLKFLIKPSLEPYQTSKDDLYWKTGLALHDVNAAIDVINKAIEHQKGGKSKEDTILPGKQFLDIGFLTHIKDPCGFNIELLQTTFEDNQELRTQLIKDAIKEEEEVLSQLKAQSSNGGMSHLDQSPSLLVSQPFVIGQITTRITDPGKALDFYTNVLKMKLLSIQEVKQYRFTLYFLAFTEDSPPEKDNLKHVKNREWLWQRKYTMLELQWRWDCKLLNQGNDTSTGLDSIEVEIDNGNDPLNLLKNLKKESRFFPVTSKDQNLSFDGYNTQVHGIITDPDGLKIKIISKCLDKDVS